MKDIKSTCKHIQTKFRENIYQRFTNKSPGHGLIDLIRTCSHCSTDTPSRDGEKSVRFTLWLIVPCWNVSVSFPEPQEPHHGRTVSHLSSANIEMNSAHRSNVAVTTEFSPYISEDQILLSIREYSIVIIIIQINKFIWTLKDFNRNY